MDWHTRYTQQARWTQNLRTYLFDRAGLAAANRVLDLGCGTGALLEDITVKAGAAIHGADLSLPSVMQAAIHAPGVSLLCADGASLPYAGSAFDIVFCHFVLLWVADPLQVLTEMRRVTRPGGVVLALAEPDYGGRVDYPAELSQLGRWQAESLRQQGADPEIGRKLAGLFNQAGLRQVETGVLGGEWLNPPTPAEREMEWDVLQADLAGKIPSQDFSKMKELEQQAWERGERVLFVPTFFASGHV
jgi:SAM-dependent methyltransferase